MDKMGKDIRIRPYIVNSVGLLISYVVVFIIAYVVLNCFVEFSHNNLLLLILLPSLVIHYIKYFRTDFLVVLDVFRKKIIRRNVKVLKTKHYHNGTKNYREVFSWLYKNHSTCRYSLKLENLSENKEMIMYMYLTHEEVMSINKLSESGKRFCITYLKHAKAIIKIETIE
jgi:hypothetical protein